MRFAHGYVFQCLAFLVLAPLAFFLAQPTGSLWGMSGDFLFWSSVAVATVQQVWVALIWRLELFHRTFSRRFGKKAVGIFGVVFMPLLVLRPLTVGALAWADRESLFSMGGMSLGLFVLLALPAIWAMASVLLYFGIPRALGIDHFDPGWREPFVKKGAFKYVPNSMYALVFLFFWAMALGAGSRAALAAAFFQHAFVWVHYFATEKPDMQVIYGGRPLAGSARTKK
jgi:hypothetical protein